MRVKLDAYSGTEDLSKGGSFRGSHAWKQRAQIIFYGKVREEPLAGDWAAFELFRPILISLRGRKHDVSMAHDSPAGVFALCPLSRRILLLPFERCVCRARVTDEFYCGTSHAL